MHTRRIVYILILAGSVALSVMYLEQRALPQRYEAFQQSEGEISAAKEQIRALEEALAEERALAEDMESNPLEVEAAIRRIKRGVRDGEIMYHVEGRDPASETEADRAAQEERS